MILFASVAFLFGACVGSFLNVVILRLPAEESLWRRNSHCVTCNASIPPYFNIPLISYLVLRGRCHACGARFSAQYFIVELLTALVFAGTFWLRFDTVIPFLFQGEHPPVALLKAAAYPWLADVTLISALIATTWIDARHYIIPLEITVTGTLIGCAISLLYPAFRHEAIWWHSLGAAGMALVPGAGMMMVIRWAGSWYFKREALGLGDVHLMVMLAMFMNWPLILLVLLLSSILGSIGGIATRIVQRRGTWRFEVPYGPYIAAAAVVAYFFGQPFIAWYISRCMLF